MKVIIFHGLGASSNDNWFMWLKKELESKNIDVFVPNLPNSQNPKQEDWIKEALKLSINSDAILVGHSLGTILIMRLLEKIKVKAAYLVSGFDEASELAILDNFFEDKFNYDKIKSNVKNITILNSDNDPFIPMSTTLRLQKNLDCGLIVFEAMDHLNAGTGDCEFIELRDLILKENESN